MSKYFAIVDGKALDWHFRPVTDNHYAFYVGDMLLGSIFNLSRNWSAVCAPEYTVWFERNGLKQTFGSVQGFKTRFDAAEYLLKTARIEDGLKHEDAERMRLMKKHTTGQSNES